MLYGRNKTLTLTPTITTIAYSAGDVIGGLLEFDVSGGAGGGGILQSLCIIDDANVKADVTLYLFDSEPTEIADNAAFAPALADLKKIIYALNVPSASQSTLNGNGFYFRGAIDQGFSAPTGKLYGYLVATATPTYAAATDLTLRLSMRLD